MKSMTGFGRFDGKINARDIVVEIKSVNHRFFEFSCRTTRGFNFLEDKIKTVVGKQVARGKVDMFVSLSAAEDEDVVVELNKPLADGYVAALKELAAGCEIKDDISVSTVARYNDIFTVRKAQQDEDKVLSDVMPAVEAALQAFVDMRIAEGNKLKADVQSRAERILELVAVIEEKSPQMQLDYEKRLKDKIDEMLQGAGYDEQRIITEVAIFSDKVAIAEETVRLRSHFGQFAKMLESDQAVGRKLDFILQEMNRETNTIGSKVQNSEISHIVVEIKSELEKIREQIQNVE
ncbi:MAG: YicC family protein [Oscillospiraceae bacterium]|jgi:uncharacterized protein (TIGR00255 family)|nr:YicC family protein [Oscillospiraceae bacterium]